MGRWEEESSGCSIVKRYRSLAHQHSQPSTQNHQHPTSINPHTLASTFFNQSPPLRGVASVQTQEIWRRDVANRCAEKSRMSQNVIRRCVRSFTHSCFLLSLRMVLLGGCLAWGLLERRGLGTGSDKYCSLGPLGEENPRLRNGIGHRSWLQPLGKGNLE